MTRRRWERLLWACTLLLALGGWVRWKRAHPEAAAPAPPSLTVPPPVRGAAPARLAAAAEEVARNDPFRLDRVPAPLGSSPPGPFTGGAGPGYSGYTPPGGYAPPRSAFAGTPLRVAGISGPPWEALLEGVPGRPGAVVVRPGDRVEDLRIRSISADLVVVQGQDTTWRLPIKRTGQ